MEVHSMDEPLSHIKKHLSLSYFQFFSLQNHEISIKHIYMKGIYTQTTQRTLITKKLRQSSSKWAKDS